MTVRQGPARDETSGSESAEPVEDAAVSIVLITWNSEGFLDRCIEGIVQQTFPHTDLFVIDNGSTDGSVERVRTLYPTARLQRNESNMGFSAAANQGIAASRGEFVLLLNPDVLMEPAYVERCVEGLVRKGSTFGSATGKLLRGIGQSIQPTRVVDSKGIRMTRNGRHLDLGAGLADDPAERDPFEVFGVSGAAALYRRAFLADVAVDGKPFDEAFFVYREDADIAWRGRLFGWRAVSIPGAIAYHVRTVTPEKRRTLPASVNMHSVKNRFLLRVKNQGRYLTLRHLPGQLARDIVVLAAALTVERSSLPAFRWLWQHRREIMRSRRAIQQRRTVSDRELAPWFRNG